jgi:Ca-activated chloride channel family protein
MNVRLGCGLMLAAMMAAGMPICAQSGVLLPNGKDKPDPAVLSLDEMSVSIVIDNGDAHVSVTQIFANHTKDAQEGNYTFALPSGSTVSDFAIWDGPVRIPAVIMEAPRADAIYVQSMLQNLFPGLQIDVEPDEPDLSSQPKQMTTFSTSVSPVRPYGTERIELEYHQQLRVDQFAQGFTYPFKPTENLVQKIGKLTIHFELHSTMPIVGFAETSKTLPLKLTQNDAHTVLGDWQSTNVTMTEDLTAAWKFDASAADALMVSTFRNPRAPQPAPDLMKPVKPSGPEPGFFLAQTLIAPVAAAPSDVAPRDVVVLLDTSLSMQWDKLERSYAALEATLRSLKPTDQFSLLLFNQDATPFEPQAVAATPLNVQKALDFVRASKLRGGTDIGKALSVGLKQAKGSNASLYLFTDGNSDRGVTVVTGKIAAQYKNEWQQTASHPRTNIFAVGDDANLPLLNLLAQNLGLLENVLSTEPVDAKLSAFLAHGTSKPVSGLGLDVSPASAVHTMYPLDDSVYAGSIAAWVGDYTQPVKGVTFTAHANREGNPLNAKTTVDLPVESLAHPELPRIWAQARVNALLAQIARDGETRAAIDEIIALSRRYKFVTPYTSFLAAPRSLLRPRVIRPGDPVLRVHTDPAITSVVALFPFGLTKELRHLSSEDTTKGRDADHVWETRFLAPPEMQDGTYTVRLILRDVKGNTYSEQKTFVIASTPPTVTIKLERTRFHRGEVMRVSAGATASTRTLTARLEGAAPVDLRWSRAAEMSTGEMLLPETLAPGRYTLSVTAEDVAHNVGSQEVQIEVLP